MEAGLPFVGMITVMLIQAGNLVVCKAAMSRGIDKYIIIVYSNAISTLILFPFSFIFHRLDRPLVTFSTLCKIFVLALVGYSAGICGFTGVNYSSPTLATALLNLIPAFTFILATIFRMEKLDWRSSSSQAKIIGTLVSIAGAFVVTFYKGPPIKLTEVIHPSPLHLLSLQPNWITGGFFLATEALLCSLWYILQASILENYPAVLNIVFYHSFFSTIQSAMFSLIAVKDPSSWQLRPDIGLVAVLFSAIFAIVLRISLLTWCMQKTGPLYCSMFKPLAIIFAGVMSITFLRDPLYLGSFIGAIIIVTGFYAMMWGKASELGNSTLSSKKVPLLQNEI